jgi:CHASE2 domain-containing sensor protein
MPRFPVLLVLLCHLRILDAGRFFDAKALSIMNSSRRSDSLRRLDFNRRKDLHTVKIGCFLIPHFLAFLLFTMSSTVLGASFRDDFAVVFIDAASEAKFGPFPFDRSIQAKAIRRAGELGAKGVVMKFFFDQPKEQAGDVSLAAALTNLPVLLQACLDDSEVHPNPLLGRFTVPGLRAQTQISGHSGIIPLPMFSVNARDVGFVDFASTQVPLLETYQTKTVKSLVVCCIELATGAQAIIAPDGRMMFGASGFRMDGRHCVAAKLPAKDDLAYIPFNEFLMGTLPASRIKGKVVIIGYDGPHIQSISTSIGPIRAHRFFVYVLQSIYEQVGD